MTRVTGRYIGCRWEDLFAAEVADIASATDEWVRVIDSDGILRTPGTSTRRRSRSE